MSISNDPIFLSKLPCRPTLEEYPREVAKLSLGAFEQILEEVPHPVGKSINPDEALDYAQSILPTLAQARRQKIAALLLRAEVDTPQISWTVIGNLSWAVGTLAAMRAVIEVAGDEGFATTLEVVQNHDNQWRMDQWTVRMTIFGEFPR